MKFLVVGGQTYGQLVEPFGEVIYYNSLMTDKVIEEVDCVMFTGGADVSPDRYGHRYHPKTFVNDSRDTVEFALFTRANALNKKFIGICRGAQLLCVANGDTLIQDVSNHLSCTHDITTLDGKSYKVVGDHHQMMKPYNGKVVATSHNLSDRYRNGEDKDSPFKIKWPGGGVEPEVVWYDSTEALCVQYHPEWSQPKDEGRTYFNQLVEEYIL